MAPDDHSTGRRPTSLDGDLNLDDPPCGVVVWNSQYMNAIATPSDIRVWAIALPEVTEKQHFRFKVPLWQVRGKTFLGMGRDQNTAVFCITEGSARTTAAVEAEHAVAVNRMNAQRSFLGLEVQLAGVPTERIKALIREASATQAPKTLVKQHLGVS
jgi:hypothetical protein